MSIALTLIAVGAAPLGVAQNASQSLPTVKLNAGIHNIRAELAQTPEQRAIGLMNRAEMAANDGMLFNFEAPAPQCFWMKNTLTPQSLASHCSAKPVRLALEMNQGWFAKRGLKAGSKLSGPPFKP